MMMVDLLRDLRHALRALARSPFFTLGVVLVLGLGIGGTTAMFTVIHGVVLRPLPFPEADRLMSIGGAADPPGYDDPLVAWNRNEAFAGLALVRSGGVNLLVDGRGAQRVSAAVVSASFFPVFGVQPVLGRAFAASEERAGHNGVAILGHGLWQRDFGGDAGVLGRSIKVNGVPHSVVGVMPPGFSFPERTDVWVPRAIGRQSLPLGFSEQPDFPWSHRMMIGRLRAGVIRVRAQAELGALFSRLQSYARARGSSLGEGVRITPLKEVLVRNSRPGLLLLLGAVCFVLLIACSDAAGMLLARAAARQKDLAVRVCLGASRWRIVGQLLAESTVLAILGCGLGLLLTVWVTDVIRMRGPAEIARLGEVSVDRKVLLFALLVSFATGVVVGLAPGLAVLRQNLTQALKDGGFRSAAGARQRVRRMLVTAQVTLALVLSIGAGLMLKSLLRLTEVEPGFRPENVLTTEFDLPGAGYRAGPESVTEEASRIAVFHRRLFEGIERLPGVLAAGSVNVLPLSGRGRGYLYFDLAGKTVGGGVYHLTSGEYFRALGIPLLSGRWFNQRDARDAPRVVIINQTMARRFWGARNPVGETLDIECSEGRREVVGVVGDVKVSGLAEQPESQFYLPDLQPCGKWDMPRDMTVVVRTTGDAGRTIEGLRAIMRSLDKEVPLFRVKSMQEVVAASVGRPRFHALLVGAFALLGTLLAVLGVYGVVAYSVARRTHEIGIRLSLGALPRDVLRMILEEGVRLATVGILVGLPVAYGLSRWISTLLFGVSAADPVTYLASAVVLLAAVLAGCIVPAWKASKLDPVTAIRYE